MAERRADARAEHRPDVTETLNLHIAIVTAIAPAHSEFFPDESAIADAKGEIFQGLEPGGTAIVPFDRASCCWSKVALSPCERSWTRASE